MTFQREERYIVVKIKDLKFASVENKLRDILNEAGIQTRECVVVESDWPEYEIVWGMLQARVEGKPNRIEQLERELANARDIAKKLTSDVLRRGQRLAESQAREEQMREALSALRSVCFDRRKAYDEFERLGDLYYREFGRLRPGKDDALRDSSDEDNMKQYEMWSIRRTADAIDSADEALSIPTDDTALRQAIAKELREAADYADANNVCGNVSMDWLRRRSDELENGK
jgi:hypothetical protein